MTSLLEHAKKEADNHIQGGSYFVGGIDPGMSKDAIDDWATDITIEIFSDMGFGAEDSESGDTEKLYGYIEENVKKALLAGQK